MTRYQMVHLLRQITNKEVEISTTEPVVLDYILEQLGELGLETKIKGSSTLPSMQLNFNICVELAKKHDNKGEALKWEITRILCNDGWEPCLLDSNHTTFTKKND